MLPWSAPRTNRIPISRVRCATENDRSPYNPTDAIISASPANVSSKPGDERLTSKGIFNCFVNCFYVRGRRIGRNFMQHLVKLRSQVVRRHRPAKGDLHEGSGDAIERRAGFGLRETEVNLGLGRLAQIELFHVGDNAHDPDFVKSAFAH